MHDRADTRSGAAISAAAINIETVILLNIVLFLAQGDPLVEFAEKSSGLLMSAEPDKFARIWQHGFGMR